MYIFRSRRIWYGVTGVTKGDNGRSGRTLLAATGGKGISIHPKYCSGDDLYKTNGKGVVGVRMALLRTATGNNTMALWLPTGPEESARAEPRASVRPCSARPSKSGCEPHRPASSCSVSLRTDSAASGYSFENARSWTSGGHVGEDDGWLSNFTIRIVWKEVRRCTRGQKHA